jgi:hypothetical protein
MRVSLEDKLVRWLMEQTNWVAKGHITRTPWRDVRGVEYLPETVGRALRSAEEGKRIAVKYEGKNTMYKWLPYDKRATYIPTSERTGDALFLAQ